MSDSAGKYLLGTKGPAGETTFLPERSSRQIISTSVTIGAKSLSIRDDVDPPLDTAKRKFAFSASTRGAASDHRVVPSLPGGNGDPTAGGATLRIYNAMGTTTDDVTIDLPASGWTVLGSPTRPQGYRFTGPSTGPIRRVVVKNDTMRSYSDASSLAASAPASV